MTRFNDIIDEVLEVKREDLTDQDILNYAFRRFLRRMQDKEFDEYDSARCKGKTEEEIKEILIQDIISGKAP